MCSSDFVFRKDKRDSAFRVSGVLQLAKTGPRLMKNFPLLRLFPSDAMMAWRLYTPYDVKRTNLHILTARRMSHILTRIGQLWRDRKIILRAGPELNSKIMNWYNIDLNFLEWKRGQKFHFIGSLKQALLSDMCTFAFQWHPWSPTEHGSKHYPWDSLLKKPRTLLTNIPKHVYLQHVPWPVIIVESI